MEPIDFKEKNFTYKKPASMTDEECSSLDCYKAEDGQTISKWKLTWKERFKIFFTGVIWHSVLMQPPAPVYLTVDTPFLKQKEPFKLWWFIKCITGFDNVIDGSTCWFSRKFWDVHDYYSDKGGDDTACHIHTYKIGRAHV